MKTHIVLFMLAFVSLTSVSYADTKPKKEAVVVVSDKYDMFTFKADKKFLGATIEVHNSNNTLTGKEFVYHRKMVIDFYYLPADTYRITIKKDNELVEFQFTKE